MSVYFCLCAREMFVKQYFILFRLQWFRLQSFFFSFLSFIYLFFSESLLLTLNAKTYEEQK